MSVTGIISLLLHTLFATVKANPDLARVLPGIHQVVNDMVTQDIFMAPLFVAAGSGKKTRV